MSIGIGILVFLVSFISLIAEFILYFIFGFGAAFTGGISSLEGTAFIFVGLMILTGSIGVLFPLCAIAATLSKKQSLWTKIFLCIIGIIFAGYFFVLPASINKSEKSGPLAINPAPQSEKISANDALAKSTLSTLSTAAETFAKVNNGNYPTNITSLTDANPPYISTAYCGTTVAGFVYTCEWTTDGYTFTATPVTAGTTGTTMFTMTTGGILKEENKDIVQKMSPAVPAASPSIQITESAEIKYIKDSLILKDIKIVDGYGQFDVPGYSATKKAVSGTIKNTGDKSIKYLELTIYFLDSNGLRIGEKSGSVISAENIFDPTPPLKPNYTKDFGVIIQEDIPSDWAGKLDVEISKIQFHLQ